MPNKTKSKPTRKKKPGRREERLIVTRDPKAALDRLLNKKPTR